MKERIYLGGFELYREYNATSGTVSLERETLHVMDGKQQRVALVETRTQGDDGTAAQLIRYQLGNHLGSASLELNEAGAIISYEEYYPYGSTSYQAVDKSIKAAAKRYRYTGRERDEETGLAYHRARYYAGWLGRWTSPDPRGIKDGVNIYNYVRSNPANKLDPGGLTAISAGVKEEVVEINNMHYQKFTASENTWISKSAESLGLDQKYDASQGFGAYVPGVVLDQSKQPFSNTDSLLLGQTYYIQLPEASTQNSYAGKDLTFYSVSRDIRGSPIGAHKFIAIVSDNKQVLEDFISSEYPNLPGIQDEGEDYKRTGDVKIQESSDNRFFITLGGYNMPTDTVNKMVFRFNEKVELTVFNRRFGDYGSVATGEYYEIEHKNTPDDIKFARRLINGSLYHAKNADFDYPNAQSNIFGNPFFDVSSFGIENPKNSNTWANSLLFHSGATNIRDNSWGRDPGSEIRFEKEVFGFSN